MIAYKHPLNQSGIDYHIKIHTENTCSTQNNKIYVIPITIEEFNLDLLNKGFALLFEEDAQLINNGLSDITQLTVLNHDEVIKNISPEILDKILNHMKSPQTCFNSLRLLSLLTFFSDLFYNYISSDYFYEFIHINLADFYQNEMLFGFCIRILISLFSSNNQLPNISNKLFNMFEYLLKIPQSEQNKLVVILYSNIIKRAEIPKEIFDEYRRYFMNLIKNPNTAPKCFTIALYTIQRLLDGVNSNEIQDIIISNSLILKSLLNHLDDKNAIYCLCILRKLVLKNDTFSPQLIAYDFNKILRKLCESNNEDIQYAAIQMVEVYEDAFEDMAKEFLNFDFINSFSQASFKIKIALVTIYHRIFYDIIEKFVPQYIIPLNDFFLNDLLDIVGSSTEGEKCIIYDFLCFLFQSPNNIDSTCVNLVSICVNHPIMDVAKTDFHSELEKVAFKAQRFLHFIEICCKTEE